MRVRWQAPFTAAGHVLLFQTFWRPGTSGGSNADATDMLARVHACLSSFSSALSANIVFNAVTEVDALEDTSGALTGTWTGVDPGQVVGGAAGDMYSPAAAILVRAHTSLIVGRRFLKGRTFLPGLAENIIDSGGKVSVATAGGVTAGFTGMLTGGSTASFPVVWHRPTKLLPASGTSGPVTSYSVETNYLGVQRRRRF